MLILAGVTVATLFGENGIVNKAQKAKEETEKSTKNELDALNSLEGEMENAINGSGWRQPDPLKPEITNGEITLKIGDYVDYDCTTSDATYTSPAEKSGHTQDQVFNANEYQYGWRVLGVDKNTKQLQLISEDFAQPSTGGETLGVRQAYILKGQEGYVNGVDELNKICSIYGTGNGATSARVVNVDDINWITGYNPNNTGVKDPNKTGSGTKGSEGQIHEYGNNVKYTLLSIGVKYEPTNGVPSRTNVAYKQFTYYDEANKTWKSLATNESVTLKNSSYYYYPTTLTETDDTTATIGIANTSPEYKMLFTNSSTGADTANVGNTDNFGYWLGWSAAITSVGTAFFNLGVVGVGYIIHSSLHTSYGDTLAPYCGIRPVVTLDSKVNLKDSGTMKDGCKLYNMTLTSGHN